LKQTSITLGSEARHFLAGNFQQRVTYLSKSERETFLYSLLALGLLESGDDITSCLSCTDSRERRVRGMHSRQPELAQAVSHLAGFACFELTFVDVSLILCVHWKSKRTLFYFGSLSQFCSSIPIGSVPILSAIAAYSSEGVFGYTAGQGWCPEPLSEGTALFPI
jgi:hypothetical protein